MSTTFFEMQGVQTPLPFLLLSIFLGSLYMLLFMAFVLLCLCKPKRRQFIVPALLFQSVAKLNSRVSSLSSAFTAPAKSSTSALVVDDKSLCYSPTRERPSTVIHSPRRLPTNKRISTSRKLLIFLYVCFRAFTIFLFTFSVGLSVLLSVESDSFKTLVSCVHNAHGDRIRELANEEAKRRSLSMQNARRTTPPWLYELRQIEQASDDELSRQTTYLIQQSLTCEMQELRASGEMGLSMAEAANLVAARTNASICGIRLSPNDPKSCMHYMAIANATVDYLENEHWIPYNFSVQKYLENMRGLLDNHMVQHWSLYTHLLHRMLDNSWLRTAHRAMNATIEALQSPETGHFSVRSLSAPGYFAGLTPTDPREVEALTFAGFLGIPQPADARYVEAQMWNSLRQNVRILKSLRYLEKSLYVEPLVKPAHVSGLSQTTGPFKYCAYCEFFTTDDLDILPLATSKSGTRNNLWHNLTTTSISTGKNVVISLREWINMAYLRIFLLALDGYLIVSRFYSACRNFCALWLGKRRRLYHHSSQSPTSPTERTKLNNPSNGVLLWRSSEVEQLSLSNNGDALSSQATNVNDSIPARTGSSALASDAALPSTLSNDQEAAAFTVSSQRGSLPACCCCLDFHYLLILLAICLMIVGLIMSTGAGKGVGNSWLMRKSALFSRLEAMDDYRRHTQAMVHHVQLDYLNTKRLSLERHNAARQLRRLKRIQQWLHYEQEHLLRQNLYEICVSLAPTSLNHQNFHVSDNSICHRVKQDQQRRQQSPYSTMASRKSQKSKALFMPLQDQHKLPLCAFLPVQSTETFNSTLKPQDRRAIFGGTKSEILLLEKELHQIYQVFFKNSTFAAFLTSIYRLLFTAMLLSMCVCWLLAYKHLIMQMATRTVAVVTSRVTVISPHPPASRRIGTFLHSSEGSLSFPHLAGGSLTPSRFNIWHSDDDPLESNYLPTADFSTEISKHDSALISFKKPKRHLGFRRQSLNRKLQNESTETQV